MQYPVEAPKQVCTFITHWCNLPWPRVLYWQRIWTTDSVFKLNHGWHINRTDFESKTNVPEDVHEFQLVIAGTVRKILWLSLAFWSTLVLHAYTFLAQVQHPKVKKLLKVDVQSGGSKHGQDTEVLWQWRNSNDPLQTLPDVCLYSAKRDKTSRHLGVGEEFLLALDHPGCD